MDILEIAKQMQQAAWRIVEDTRIILEWEGIGAEVNLVGSLKSGLLMKNRDIDFHVYTEKLIPLDSFLVMGRIAEHPAIKEIWYKNLVNTEEECIEWHAWYEDRDKNRWKLDLIHIRKGSMYAGVVEKVTEEIIRKLTPEQRKTILQIKQDIPDGTKVQGIEIYRAVISDGVNSYNAFREWQKSSPSINYLKWFP